MSNQKSNASSKKAFIPILFFLILLLFGLFINPVVLKNDMLPVEVLVILSLTFTCFYLMYLGHSWKVIQSNITKKIGESVPVIMILMAVGVLIGSWIVSGTIPMLLYYGISLVSPDWIYVFSFVICILFSLLTGTSWGSAGTIGVVMIGISEVFGADIAITAAAVVGGSFFGDKLSPLSDTTNIAALASEIPVLEHIRSMLYTTVPAAILAAVVYTFLSPVFSGQLVDSATELSMISTTLSDLKAIFNFHILLLLPLFVVIYGSVTKKPIFLTLLVSAFIALSLGLIFQSFSISEVFNSLNTGFSTSMVDTSIELKSDVLNILNRGGLYNLKEGVYICLVVFMFLGALKTINAIEETIKSMMRRVTTRRRLIVSALSSTWLASLIIANQYATSFLIAETFKEKFDQLKVDRKVLSRSIEDAGTMMENLMPWTPSGLFMFGTLGVSSFSYAPYQFMSIFNIIIAYFFAVTGIACFYKKDK